MTHTYQITGMTCGGCEAKVKASLSGVEHITDVSISREINTARVTMDKHVPIAALQDALGGANSKYHINAADPIHTQEPAMSWVQTYKPILLIFFYIALVTLL